MCGIVGLYLKNENLHSELGKIFGPMLTQMGDRGPDSSGFGVYRKEKTNSIKITFYSPKENFDWLDFEEALEKSFKRKSSIIQIGGNDLVDEESLSDNTLIANTIGFSTNFYKNLTSRQLQPRYGFDFNIDYTDLKTEDQAKINFLMQTELNFYLPSFTQNQGMKLGFTLEKRPNVEYLYKMQEDYVPLTGYTFSRGYSYDFTAEFRKTTFEYINPLFYPNDGFGRWIYFPRLYSKLFFDSTAVFNEELDPRTLNSMGLELYFESYTFRKFPLTYGLRFLQKEKDESQHGEVFLATNIFI